MQKLILGLWVLSSIGFANIVTNNINFTNPPPFVTESKIEKVVSKVGGKLEWDIRKVNVYYYANDNDFQKIQSFGPSVQAFSRASDGSVHLGPKVNEKNWEQIFGHELVHVILWQKYKKAIPAWLEEGMANYISGSAEADYAWLATQPLTDVTLLSHPYKGNSNFRYHYIASQAVMEMIASKCSLYDLLQLSVGKKLETYLNTFCEIKDVNAAFKDWVAKKAPKKS